MITRSVEALIHMLDADYIEHEPISKTVRGVSIDSRKLVEGNLYIPIVGETFNGHDFVEQAIEHGAAATLWNRSQPNPPTAITVILVDDTLEALQNLAYRYRRQLDILVVGITGSNGKTSTKDILAAMLSSRYITQKTLGNYNNEIGVPLTLLSLSESTQAAVIEMGMERFHELELLTAMVEPDIAIITNVGEAHKENLGSLENIAKAKLEIVQGLPDFGLLIYNGDQNLLVETVHETDMKTTIRHKRFGEHHDNDMWISSCTQTKDGIDFQVNELEDIYHLDMLGHHQAFNACAALIAARELGCTTLDIQFGLRNIEKTGLRNELAYAGECVILNDSYKSNPQSLKAALDTFAKFESSYKIAVIGDMLDLGDDTAMIHYHCGCDLANYDLNEVLTIGDLACYVTQGARNSMSDDVHIEHFSEKENLLAYLKPYVQRDCMLLVKGSRALTLDTLVDDLITYSKEVK